ncbi:MAG: acyl-CoA desaturase [Planctomycetales bacterium]
MMLKATALISIWVGIYSWLMVYGVAYAPWSFLGVVAFSLSTLTIQLAVMHDASHRSIAAYDPINQLFSLVLTFIGAASILWHQQHVVSHHTHTNIAGKDPDIRSYGIFRYQASDEWSSLHRWQHWYAIPMYAFVAIRWAWFVDFYETITNTYNLRGKQYWMLVGELVVSRTIHVFLFLYLPYMVVGNIWVVLGCYLVQWMIFGCLMALVFQCAHVTGVQEYPTEEQDDYLIHQISTTANFSTGNHLLSHLIGGLNFQIEHHLFPRLSHLNYPIIQPVVKQFCEEHGITYNEAPTFFHAVVGHLSVLKRFSTQPKKQSAESETQVPRAMAG